MLSKTKRAMEYVRLHKQHRELEEQSDQVSSAMDDLYLKPFRTVAANADASCALSGLLKNPDGVYQYSTDLLNVRGGLCWSDASFRGHIGKIFRHFIEVGVLLKGRKGYKLNPLLKNIKERED